MRLLTGQMIIYMPVFKNIKNFTFAIEELITKYDIA